MSTIKRVLTRGGPLVVLLALALAVAAPAANASPATDAATWLSSSPQLKSDADGTYCELGGPSVGQSIDCQLAFKAAGYTTAQGTTYDWIVANKDTYVHDPCVTTIQALSAGAVAKLAVSVEAQGDDPQDVGTDHRDLIADLQCLQDGSGRFSDKNQTDYSNVFGQSLAIIALERCKTACGSPPLDLDDTIDAAVGYLRGQQCSGGDPDLNGAFRSSLGLVADECNDNSPFPPDPPYFDADAVDVDSTAVAVQALLAENSLASQSSASDALDWLASQEVVPTAGQALWQNYCDFNDSGTLYPSVNSTAQVVMAYVDASISPTPAQTWLASTVNTGPSDFGMPACTGSGAGDVLATGQGILGLFGTSYTALVAP